MVRRASGFITVFMLIAAASLHAERYRIVPGGDDVGIRFESKAPLESFGGETSALSGFIVVNPTDLSDSIDIRLDIALDSLDTGIPLRDRHMRENHLETDRFPLAQFVSRTLVEPHADRLLDGRELFFEVEGELTLHGVTRKVVLPVNVTRGETDEKSELIITSDFNLKLSDYNISRPKFLVMKLNDVQYVQLSVRAILAEKGR